MSQEEMESPTPIQKFYQGKSVLITGATGFIGKVLLEKLLRSCPGINRIYLLVREKRGKSGKQRVDELFSYELFDLLRKERPNFAEKVSIVYGDLYSPFLGIKSEDVQELSENVNIVFHAAGRMKWDDNLRQVNMMMEGDVELEDLEYCKKLESAGQDILSDKELLVKLDAKRNSMREAIRGLQNMKRSKLPSTKTWICIDNMFVKIPLDKALSYTMEEQKSVEEEIKSIRDNLKVKVNCLRELEGEPGINSGYHLNPLSKADMEVLGL